jgi:uncharacterized membrane protein YedE/YeeE
MGLIASLVAGLIFGAGLIISGMADPAKVQNFLDVAGTFDPSLAFVMIGAIAVTVTGYHFVLQRPKPLASPRFHLPTKSEIDTRLVAGAAIFGIGWGLAGFCPGPALVSLGIGSEGARIFVLCMLFGMAAAAAIAARRP